MAKLFLTFSLFLFSLTSFASKINVCTLTINSSNEKDEFKRMLGTKDFNFIEILNKRTIKSIDKRGKNPWKDDWIGQRCKEFSDQNINCDILIISGYFTGEVFFGMLSGRKRRRIFIDHLEQHSCNQTCNNILKKPKLVFMFGANTTAGKRSDKRSKEEYLRIVKTGRIGVAAAQRIVESRYGAYGAANSSRLRRIFGSKVPPLGFSSEGIVGSEVKPKLEEYLKLVGDFKEEFLKLKESSSSRRYSSQSDFEEVTTILSTAFNRVFEQKNCECSSTPPPDHCVNTDSPELRGRICRVIRDKDPGRVKNVRYDERLRRFKQELKGKDHRHFLHYLEEFIRKHPPMRKRDGSYAYPNEYENEQIVGRETKDGKRVGGIAQVNPTGFTELLGSFKGFPKLQTLSLGRYVGWVSEKEFNKVAKEIIDEQFKAILKRKRGRTLDQDTIDLTCHLSPLIKDFFKYPGSKGIKDAFNLRKFKNWKKLSRCFKRIEESQVKRFATEIDKRESKEKMKEWVAGAEYVRREEEKERKRREEEERRKRRKNPPRR